MVESLFANQGCNCSEEEGQIHEDCDGPKECSFCGNKICCKAAGESEIDGKHVCAGCQIQSSFVYDVGGWKLAGANWAG